MLAEKGDLEPGRQITTDYDGSYGSVDDLLARYIMKAWPNEQYCRQERNTDENAHHVVVIVHAYFDALPTSTQNIAYPETLLAYTRI